MTHAIFAAVLTLLAGLFGHALVGAVAAAFFYYGREVTQAEYRWMKPLYKDITRVTPQMLYLAVK